MRRIPCSLILLSFLSLLSMPTMADSIQVTTFRHTGPYMVRQPALLDSVDIGQKKFTTKSLLDTPIDLSLAKDGTFFSDTIAPGCGEGYALHLLQFDIEARGYAKAKVEVGAPKQFHLYVDGKKSDGKDVELLPGSHSLVVKYLAEGGKEEKVKVKLTCKEADVLALGSHDGKHLFGMKDVMEGSRLAGVELSHDGKYLITRYSETSHSGTSTWKYRLTELKTGRVINETTQAIRWMPASNRYYFTEKGEFGKRLIAVSVEDAKREVLAETLPEDAFDIAPTEDFLILTHRNTGPKKDKEVYEIVEPDDRQPGWRDRSSLVKYDLKTGLSQPLTFGFHSLSLRDISRDGRYALLLTSKSRLTKRPTTLHSLLRLDLQTLQVDTIVKDDGFVGDAKFSPDGAKLVVMGSPECLDGIGKNVPEGRIPSAYDYQLYVIDIASRQARAMTRDFNPSISNFRWVKNDGKIYFTADDRDCVHLYQMDPMTGKITPIQTGEDMVMGCSLADNAPIGVFTGESASNATRSYILNTRTRKASLLEDFSAQQLKDVVLGECHAWDFVSSRGDTINGRYYLPPHFDASKKYPVIVYYYGGCSPTSRNFATRYPMNVYAAMGYVVYVINPSGAAGFGQEFSSRHVNTAGEGVAEDIIEGTKRFAEQHSFVNDKKIGCIGASYGGFMTQYLQTKTDIFAAAISHAGISDHTSYWGEGYWGYSYSEVSMADSYPWTDKRLYVDQSPLFNADKIHTPLLFLHGVADTNVPVGESIQMFNALKLLGRETAFVAVEGENHWIMNYEKRRKWQNTIFAWFAKWLKDEPSWWQSMYKEQSM
ncbi:MAG: S9 family peptidase [Prevotella sp.]|nr:S9 family peptidase [Prevotella sp.]